MVDLHFDITHLNNKKKKRGVRENIKIPENISNIHNLYVPFFRAKPTPYQQPFPSRP